MSEIKAGNKTLAVSSDNSHYLEDLYESFLADRQSVSASWQQYFAELSVEEAGSGALSHRHIQTFFRENSGARYVRSGPKTGGSGAHEVRLERKQAVYNLIDAYRKHGHFIARLDPLGMTPKRSVPELNLSHYGLSDQSADRLVLEGETVLGMESPTLSAVHERLNSIYCGSIGFEYQHMSVKEEVAWLKGAIEDTLPNQYVEQSQKIDILRWLISVEAMEDFLGTKYVAQKRFSLQGGDSLIPLLKTIIDSASQEAIDEFVFGMAHRGRLNVLFNILGLSAKELCKEFEGKVDYGLTSGDVKYHMGFSSDVQTKHGKMHFSLAFNPSHLEFIGPVVMGSVRARQQYRRDFKGDRVMGLTIHGDASFTGQGIVMEMLNMSYVPAYNVGGLIRVVVNNQIGFTTTPSEARSGHYCTDFAKAIGAPIFHVNGDDPEAVVFAGKLAFAYRQRFRKDVVIDLICYRRHGHNEADEPGATQPVMYKKIRSHPKPCDVYANRLLASKVCTQAQVDEIKQALQAIMKQGHQSVKTFNSNSLEKVKPKSTNWAQYVDQDWDVKTDTTVPIQTLKALGKQLVSLPKHFTLQRQVGALFKARENMIKGGNPLDWGTAEMLAYASLMDQKYRVRLVGQDSRRGTFAHRHAAVYDQTTGERYIPVSGLSDGGENFQIYDSVLSESSALGFEYGYAATDPSMLVIWEAQFGDFANGAQVIIDQFVSSGCQKWRRLCGMVMLLPHGYEGLGPEHSSARLERYLQLSAQENIQVCVPSTPAQMFHMLRRQVVRRYRKPLIVMTPKSLLRHKLAVSDLKELSEGGFKLIIPEIDNLCKDRVKRVILCSGKVYYDLLAERRKHNLVDVAIIRIEQLYPFPYEALTALLGSYKKADTILWCQEEPKNQGAWYPKKHCMEMCLSRWQMLEYAGRDVSAAPAAGYPILHLKQQTALVAQALGIKLDK